MEQTNIIELANNSDRDIRSDITDIINHQCEFLHKDSFIVIFLINKVTIGKFTNNDFLFRDSVDLIGKYINQMRIFNTDGEIFFWKNNKNNLSYRIRSDSFDKNYMSECNQYLWGRVSFFEDDAKWMLLNETRGMHLIMPRIPDAKENEKIILKTYQYIDYNQKTFQAGYVDCRFVTFSKEE